MIHSEAIQVNVATFQELPLTLEKIKKIFLHKSFRLLLKFSTFLLTKKIMVKFICFYGLPYLAKFVENTDSIFTLQWKFDFKLLFVRFLWNFL